MNKTDETVELVDSHAHLDMEDFDTDRLQVIKRSFQNGIKAILCPSEVTKPASLKKTFELTSEYDSIIAAAGVHPHQAKHFDSNAVFKIKELSTSKKIKAVGEIGLDFHYDFSSPEEQLEAFRFQLNLAQELSLPVVIHSRKAGDEIVRSIKEKNFSQGGILHCFTEDWKTAEKMMDYNFLISFSGILTFPGAHSLREVVQKIPVEKLLVETDSPYLVPLSFKKKYDRNEPSFVVETARVLADLKKTPLADLAFFTTSNFKSFFKFEKKNTGC